VTTQLQLIIIIIIIIIIITIIIIIIIIIINSTGFDQPCGYFQERKIQSSYTLKSRIKL